MLIKHFLLVLLAGMPISLMAQIEDLDATGFERQKGGFQGVVTVGLNASQIDGDGLTGFNMPGIYIGVGAKYLINPEWAMGLDFLYAQKGSRTTIDDEGLRGMIRQRTRLHYVETPVIVYYSPSFSSAFTLEGGLALGYIFQGKVEYGNAEGVVTDQWTKLDFSAVGGFEYRFNRTISGLARWTYSLLPNNANYTDPDLNQILIQGAGYRNNTISVAARIYLK
jgi:hypothetical protein